MSKKAERTLKALKVLYFSANFTMGIVLALFAAMLHNICGIIWL